ncbi:MAG: methylmalonyl-CoA/ethylmalonyl-CoA epimerase [Lysobacterales bacterium]|jgi:methylmalonyl-CoA/ethylmalonyl-CoA epimerase
MINRIHHVNFLVKDLDVAIKRYQALLQTETVIREELPQRGVSTARFKVGETWIVLIQPHDPDTIPGQHMQEHGEGFFLISYQTDNLESESDRINESGIEVLDNSPRHGLDDWQVKDLSTEDLFGVSTQITQSSN